MSLRKIHFPYLQRDFFITYKTQQKVKSSSAQHDISWQVANYFPEDKKEDSQQFLS